MGHPIGVHHWCTYQCIPQKHGPEQIIVKELKIEICGGKEKKMLQINAPETANFAEGRLISVSWSMLYFQM